jgi:hypothetical protein
MEMEMEVREEAGVDALVARLTAAASVLEQAAERLAGVDLQGRAATREAELEQMLAEAEATIASLKAGRKTQPAGVATLIAREGVALDAGALDAALVSLSLEQRIAVKSQLLRGGLIG